MTDKEALKLALELKNSASAYWTENEIPIIEKLIELLADPMREVQGLGQEIEQEPVSLHIGWLVRNSQGKLDLLTELQIDSSLEKYERLHKLYTTPPQRKPLTNDELADLWYKQSLDWMEFAQAIEAAHGIKETT